jgi:hypothetical protein
MPPRHQPVGWRVRSAGHEAGTPRTGLMAGVGFVARVSPPARAGEDTGATAACHGRLGHARARAGRPWHDDRRPSKV